MLDQQGINIEYRTLEELNVFFKAIGKPLLEEEQDDGADIILKCPMCQSTNIGQYRMLTGKIWCEDCDLIAYEKEKHNPFLFKKGENKSLFEQLTETETVEEIAEKHEGEIPEFPSDYVDTSTDDLLNIGFEIKVLRNELEVEWKKSRCDFSFDNWLMLYIKKLREERV